MEREAQINSNLILKFEFSTQIRLILIPNIIFKIQNLISKYKFQLF